MAKRLPWFTSPWMGRGAFARLQITSTVVSSHVHRLKGSLEALFYAYPRPNISCLKLWPWHKSRHTKWCGPTLGVPISKRKEQRRYDFGRQGEGNVETSFGNCPHGKMWPAFLLAQNVFSSRETNGKGSIWSEFLVWEAKNLFKMTRRHFPESSSLRNSTYWFLFPAYYVFSKPLWKVGVLRSKAECVFRCCSAFVSRHIQQHFHKPLLLSSQVSSTITTNSGWRPQTQKARRCLDEGDFFGSGTICISHAVLGKMYNEQTQILSWTDPADLCELSPLLLFQHQEHAGDWSIFNPLLISPSTEALSFIPEKEGDGEYFKSVIDGSSASRGRKSWVYFGNQVFCHRVSFH